MMQITIFVMTLLTVPAFCFNIFNHNNAMTRNALYMGVWPGNRPPVTNPLKFKQSMDASWGRGKYRAEIWEDKVNPLNNWWEAYHPTEEELEAMASDFDFSNPKGWCETKNIDYEAALKETEAAQQILNDQLKEKEEDLAKSNFKDVQQEFFKLLDKAYLLALRVEDDRKQAAKGQPSLDLEDTGLQYKNDAA